MNLKQNFLLFCDFLWKPVEGEEERRDPVWRGAELVMQGNYATLLIIEPESSARSAFVRRREEGNSHAFMRAYVHLMLLLLLALPALLEGSGGPQTAPSNLGSRSGWNLRILRQRRTTPVPPPLLALRGGLGTPEPEPFAHRLAQLGCTSLARDGGLCSEDDMDEDDDDLTYRQEKATDRTVPAVEEEYEEVEEGYFNGDNMRAEGRGYVGNGLEWVHDNPMRRMAAAGAYGESYQCPQQDFEKEAAEGNLVIEDSSRIGSKQKWEKDGKNSLFAVSHAATRLSRPPPKLLPLSTIIAAKSSLVKFEGPAREVPKEGSCVPRGPIVSAEKELMEIWRDGNEFLIPHFAKQEQAKRFNEGEAGAGSRKHTAPAVADKGRHPILTPMPSPERLDALIPASGKKFVLNMTYAEALSKTIAHAQGSQVETVRAGWAVKMLRYMATRPNREQLTESAVDHNAITDRRMAESWRHRPWLQGLYSNETYVNKYEEEEMGPVETEGERRERRASTTVAVVGTGRMGKKLAEVWTRGGYHVVMGSRDLTRGKLAAGEVSRIVGVDVSGGTAEWAVKKADIVVLATPFSETAELVDQLRDTLSKKRSIKILDVTNPAYDSQSIENTAGVDIHRAVLGLDHVYWAAGYKSVFSRKLTFGGQDGQTIDICGDAPARAAVVDLVKSHGWNPRVRGGLEAAKDIEPGRRIAHLQQMYGTS